MAELAEQEMNRTERENAHLLWLVATTPPAWAPRNHVSLPKAFFHSSDVLPDNENSRSSSDRCGNRPCEMAAPHVTRSRRIFLTFRPCFTQEGSGRFDFRGHCHVNMTQSY